MNEEEINEDLSQNSPLKKTNEPEKINSKENILKNSDSSSGDLISKINHEAKALNSEINSSNLKVFEKYHNLSIKELQILLSQKNDNILNLNNQKEKYKKLLNDIIKKLNMTIKKNSNYLYDESEDQDLILNLERIKEEKRRELETSKKMNKLYKNQLESIKEKISYGDNEKKKMNLIEVKINNLKQKNSLIKKEINDIRIDKLKHKKEYDLITDNKKFLHKVKIKTEEMNNFSAQKQGYYSKLNMSMKSLDNVIKEVKRFEEIYNASINEEIEEILVKKINFWMNLIKKDLTGEKSEILARIENGQSLFLNKITNKNDFMERYSTNPTYNNVNTNMNTNINLNNTFEKSYVKTNIEKNETNNKETDNDININNNIENNEKTENNIVNKNNSIINNINNTDTMEKQSKLFKNRILINKNKSSGLFLSNLNKGNYSVKTGKAQIKFYMKNNGNINSSGHFNYNLEYKTLFRKLNYLKLKSPKGGSMKLKLNNINNLESYSKSNNNLLSEEIFENDYSPEKNIKSTGNNNELILEAILAKDYNEITNEDYRELLNKKDQYLQQNLRLEKNIEDIQKTKNKKLSNVLRVIEDNYNNLENIKDRNDLLKKEIQNLSNVQILRFEQAKLESELQPKRPNIKKIKIKTEQNKSNELNKITEINEYYTKKLKEKKSNKIDYFDEVFRKNKKVKNDKSNSKNKVDNIDDKNRDEKLQIIKEKYRKGGYDDSKDFDAENDKSNEKINDDNIENNNNISEEKKDNIDENKEGINVENIN